MTFIVKPISKEHVEALKKLFAEEGWEVDFMHPGNTLVLVNEYENVLGGVHFDVLENGVGEIKFVKTKVKGEGAGNKLVQEALKALFKHVNMVAVTPKGLNPRIKRFFGRNGFKEGLGGKMYIKKDEWRARKAR